MVAPDHETGWLELKAEDHENWAPGSKVRFKVEPSQIEWIGAHRNYCPVHVLAAVGDVWYLIPGKFIEKMATSSVTFEWLEQKSEVAIHRKTDRREILSGALSRLTFRGRNEFYI